MHNLHWFPSPIELKMWTPEFPFAQLSLHAQSHLISPEESTKARIKHSSTIIKPQAFHTYTQSSLHDRGKPQKPRHMPHGSDHPLPVRALGVSFTDTVGHSYVPGAMPGAGTQEWTEQTKVLTLMKGPRSTEDRQSINKSKSQM